MASNILIILVATLHGYFLILEMFFWNKPLGRKSFNLKPDYAESTKVLAANQGLYNGFLMAGLVWSVLQPEASFAFQLKYFFLLCVIIAGIYGAFSVSRKIFFVQSLPAILALLTVMFHL
ncbi:MAG: DUF1304 domain-containing protein [Pseudobdellovibrio sp.]